MNKRLIQSFLMVGLLAWSMHSAAATFTVSNNSGLNVAGSLYRAIIDANATPVGPDGIHVIEFTANFVITMQFDFPDIVNPVIINGVNTRTITIQTQDGYNVAFRFAPTAAGSFVQDLTIRCGADLPSNFCYGRGVIVEADGVILWRVNVDRTRFSGIEVRNSDSVGLSQVRVTRSGLGPNATGSVTPSAIRCHDSTNLSIFNGSIIGIGLSNEAAGANGSGRGIHIDACSDVLIADSTISANGGEGIGIFGGSGITIRGNFIGTSTTGNAARGNGGAGILIVRGSNLMIGGTSSAHQNIIAANGNHQIRVDPASGGSVVINGLTIQRNLIGSNANNAALGSVGNGVMVDSPAWGANLVGMVIGHASHPNTISRNGQHGIRINGASVRAHIPRNSIFLNGAGAISTSINLAAPQLSSLTATTLRGTAPTPPAGATGRIDIYADQGNEAQHYVGTVQNVNNGNWQFTPGAGFGAHQGRRLSATFTQIEGPTFRTTELSDLYIAVGGPELSVTRAGSGSGSVSSAPSGISCGNDCSAAFPVDRTVSLSATAQAGSSFVGWSGACAGTSPHCFLTGGQAANAIATFSAPQQTLTVTKSGTGAGTVTSTPGGINCGATCQANFDHGLEVTLTAEASAGSSFTGWSGSGCSGTGTRTVSMTQARSVTAGFQSTAQQAQLTVHRKGNGEGTVTSAPSGIQCGSGSGCQAQFPLNSQVTLTATPQAGSSFAGWTGPCQGAGSCVVTMDQAKTVGAFFNTSDTIFQSSFKQP